MDWWIRISDYEREMIFITAEIKEKMITRFPKEIDERIYFQDINLSQISIIQEYYKYLNLGLYSKASELINGSEVFCYGAWLLNMFEDRLCVIGEYISNLEPVKLNLLYGTTEPTDEDLEDDISWIDWKERMIWCDRTNRNG